MRKNTQSTVYKDESRLFYMSVVSFCSVFVAYVYFVSVSVADVVMRKEIDGQITALATKVGELESDYIEKQHALSSEIATQSGFVAVHSKVFIDTSADTLVLHTN